MKQILVADLIKDSILHSHPHRPQNPQVSILHPSFNGFADGSVVRLIESIQKIRAFSWELIIVDDDSNDGAKEYFHELASKDPRIVIIQHVKNVGLPAVSEYEAYMQSLAPRIAFAFDDVVFAPRAFEAMYRHAVDQDLPFVHGQLAILFKENEDEQRKSLVIGSNTHQRYSELLLKHNGIGNSSVLMKREVMETVGLYDPHVSLSRLNDWDLWIRISKKYLVNQFSEIVAYEYGPMRKTSLGNAYPLDATLAAARMQLNRSAELKPSAFHLVDTMSSKHLKEGYRSHVLDVANMHIRNGRLPAPRLRGLMLGEMTMSSFLVFDALEDESFAIDNYRGAEIFSALLAESCKYDFIIVSRTIVPYMQLNLVDIWRQIDIPVFFFVDDNYPVLAETEPEFNWYATKHFRDLLLKTSGVICPTQSLSDYFRETLKIPTTLTLPISARFDESFGLQRRNDPTDPDWTIRIGLFGGAHRANIELIELLRARFKDQALFLVTEHLGKVLGHAPDIQIVPFESSPYQFINRWQSLSLDFVIHPKSSSPNAKYKTANALLVSHLIGALPVIFDEPCFHDSDWPLKASSETDVVKLIGDVLAQKTHHELARSLQIFCTERFSGKEAGRILSEQLKFMGIKPSASPQKTQAAIDALSKMKMDLPRPISLARRVYTSRWVCPWLRPIFNNLRALKGRLAT